MKKFLSFLTMMVLMCLPLAMNAQITIDFESGTFDELSALGTMTNDATYPWVITTSAPAGYNGTYCMKSSNSGVGSSVSSIELEVTFLADGSISFLAGCWGEGTSDTYDWDKCRFYIDGETMLDYGAHQAWEDVSYPVTAGTHVFKWAYKKDGSVNPNTDAFFVDDIVFEGFAAPTCHPVSNLEATDVTENSATISWTAAEDGGNYTIQYKLASQGWDDDDVITDNTTSTGLSLSGLSSATTYNVRVGNNCGEDDNSAWRTTSFTTSCGIVTDLPYTEGFENTWMEVSAFGQTNNAPMCWTVYDGGAIRTSSGTAWKWNSGSTAHNGTTAAACYTDYGTGPHNDWLISPLIALDGNQMVSFYAQRSSSSTSEPDEISIWISEEDLELTAPADSSLPLPGFTQLAQYDLPQGAWQLYEVLLSGYSGNRYIAFVRRYEPNDGYYLRLDDIVVDDMPSCTRPANLAEEDVTSTSATLTWESDATNYILYYKAYADTAYTIVEDIAETSYTIDVTPATQYTWYISAVCDDDTLTSLQSRTFNTLCELIGTIDIPKTWGFENPNIAGTSTYPLPACWNRLGHENFPYSYNSSTYAHGGSRALSTSGDPDNYIAVLPQINTEEIQIGAMQLHFYARTYCSSTVTSARIEIGVMTDPTDSTTFVMLDTISKASTGTRALTTSYKEYEIPLTSYTDNNASYIALRFNAQGSQGSYSYNKATIYVDDVTLEVTPACERPDSLSVVPGTNSARVSWTGEGSAFNIYYRTATATEFTLANETPVSESPYTIEDLAANTPYVVKVANVCESDQSEVISNTINFTTLCGVEVAPYMEDFAGFNTSVSPCWKRYSGLMNTVVSSDTLTNSTNWSFTSNYVFPVGHPKLNIYGTSCKHWLVSPVIDISELEAPALTFSLALTDFNNANPIEDNTAQADDKFMVIISTDEGATWSLDNATVWDNAGSERVYNEISATGEDVVIPLDQYMGQNIRIAFYGESTVTSNGDNDLHIANVTVDEAPSCARPSNLALVSALSNEATVSWVGEEDGIYEVAYDTVGFALNEFAPYSTMNTFYLMEGLEPNTTYEVYVRRVCDNGGNSNWTSALTFTTLCDAFVVTEDEPFVENFNSLTSGIPDCWDNSEGTTSTATYRWNYYATGETGACVRFNSYVNASGNTNMLKTPVLNIADVASPMLSFSYKNPTGGDFSVFVSTDGGVTYPYTLATGLTGVTNWTRAEFILTDIDADNVVIVFKGTSNYANGDAYIYLDSVVVGSGSGCLRPSSVNVTNVTTDGAIVTWGNVVEGTTIELYYKKTGDSEYITVTEAEFTDVNTCQLTGLDPSSQYEVYVAALCDDETTLASDHVKFNTLCEAFDEDELPYTENFNSYTTTATSSTAPSTYPDDEMPLCWTFLNRSTSSSAQPKVFLSSSSSYAVSGNCLFFTSSSSIPLYAVLPTFVTPLQEMQITFTYRNESTGTSNGTLSIGYMTDPSNADSYIEIRSFAQTTTLTEETVVLNTIPEEVTEANIAFKYTGGSSNNYYLSIDNVVVEIIPTCIKPSGVTVEDVSESSVTLSWTPGDEDQDAWEIIYGAPGFDVETEGTTVSATSNPYTVTGLNNTTTYEFYVRANCGSDGFSSWSSYSIQASTTMIAESLPYQTDFSTDQSWLMNNGTAPNHWMMGTPSEASSSALFITNDGTSAGYSILSTSIAMAEKLFTMPATDSVHVVFDAQIGGEGTITPWDYLKVFLSPATEEFIAGTSTTANTQCGYSYSTHAFDFSAYLSQTGGSASYPYKLNLTNGNTLHIDMNVANPDPNGSAKIVFLWKNDASGGTQPGAIISNFSISEPEVGIKDVTLSQSISLMPNPADNYIDLRVNSNANVKEAVVYNAFGQMVKTVILNDNHARIDLSNMASGMYFVRVNGDNTTMTKKFIKK